MSVYEASIDDNDPTVLYSSGWVPVTTDGSWTGTMHSTSVIGSTVRIRFRGSAVAVICTIPTGGEGQRSMATISLDGGDPIFVSRETTPPVQWNYELFKADSLPLASHLLVITNAGNEAYLRLDRIDYDPTDSHAPKSTTPPLQAPAPATTTATSVVVLSPSTRNTGVDGQSSTSGLSRSTASTPQGSPVVDSMSASESTGGSSVTASVPPMTTSSAQQTSLGAGTSNTANDAAAGTQHSSDSPMTSIVGGVLGGLLFLVLLAGLIFFLSRRRRKAFVRGSGARPHLPTVQTSQRRTVPTPYDLARGHNSPHTSTYYHHGSGEEGYPQTSPLVSMSTGSEGGSSSQTALLGPHTPLSPLRRNEKDILAARLSAGLPSQDAPPAYFPGSAAC